MAASHRRRMRGPKEAWTENAGDMECLVDRHDDKYHLGKIFEGA